jgi:hypothetical protein
MTDSHVMSALKDKRARIDGEIQMRRFQIMRLEIELAHIDAVLKMFRPGFDPAKIATKRTITRSKAGTARGSGTREAMTVLREAGEPLTSRQIAERILAKHGKQVVDEDCDRLANNIHGSLSRRRDGAVAVNASVYPAQWRITAQQ